MPRKTDASTPGRFRFKHFELSNARSAQRIGTDGVLTGASAPLPSVDRPVIWDAGSGTGLIALMIAWRCRQARIIAVEVDASAAEECRANVAGSPWADRITVAEGDFSTIAPSLPAPDLIVSNPPFFDSDTRAPDSRRALARHGDGSLSPASLIASAASRLAPGGKLFFIAPTDATDAITYAATMAGMEPTAALDISSREDRAPIRRLWTFMRRSEATATHLPTGNLAIHRADKPSEYTDAFINLTRDFYLNL